MGPPSLPCPMRARPQKYLRASESPAKREKRKFSVLARTRAKHLEQQALLVPALLMLG